MTAPRTVTHEDATREPFAAVDERITRALIALRQARTASRVSPNPDTARDVERAEENLNALLDYRSAVSHRAR